MPLDLSGVKRRAKHVGEPGVFFDFEVFAEQFAKIANGTEVRVTITTERNLRQLAFAWVLASKIAENSDTFLDREDAMDNVPWGLKCRAGHAKAVVNPETGAVTIKPLSLKRLDGEAFKRLLNRMVYVACHDIIPGMEPGPLTDEIEAMLTRKGRK